MAIISTTQAKVGDQLRSDVQTALGSVLMEKGRQLSERDLHILQAFLVSTIDVNRPDALDESDESSIPEQSEARISPLQKQFLIMEKLLLRTVSMIGAGLKPPVLELRNEMKVLLEQMGEYSVVTFVPFERDGDNNFIRNGILCAMTSCQLAKWLKLPEKDHLQIAMAGLLHDIGNVKVDQAIFRKPGKLTEAEQEEIRQHTVYGYRILENISGLNQGVWLAALQHHERVDGSGYPMKVKGDKIHAYAKIVAIADMYHAMTSNRYYRKAESPYLVLEELHSESFGKLDPLYVQTFIERTTQLHNGVVVKLNDGRMGEIIFTDRNSPTRPMISVNGEIINLAQQRQIFIYEVSDSNK